MTSIHVARLRLMRLASRQRRGKSSSATPRSDDHDRLAEGRGVEAVAEHEVVAAVVARRQGFVGDEQVVQPARPGEADVIGRVQHARRGGQELTGAPAGAFSA